MSSSASAATPLPTSTPNPIKTPVKRTKTGTLAQSIATVKKHWRVILIGSSLPIGVHYSQQIDALKPYFSSDPGWADGFDGLDWGLFQTYFTFPNLLIPPIAGHLIDQDPSKVCYIFYTENTDTNTVGHFSRWVASRLNVFVSAWGFCIGIGTFIVWCVQDMRFLLIINMHYFPW